MVEGLKLVCAPHAPRVGLVCVGVWNHSRQTSNSPPWSISGQWIIAVCTFPIKITCCQSISGTAWNSYRRRNAIPKLTKKMSMFWASRVRRILGKLSAQIQATDWKHAHCLQHTHTHTTPNLPSAEIFSFCRYCCLPCHPRLTQANSKLIRGVLFSTVEVRHGEKQVDVANMRTQERLACVVWSTEENSYLCALCIQGRQC